MQSPDVTGSGEWQRHQARLQDALRQDELELYLQPIVPLGRSAEWRMAEVLIRMRQEERALIPPGEFLPAFELFGMLPQLDAWVLRRVVQRHLGSGVRFSINVSGQTLEHEGFVRLLAELAAPHERLLFEVEEGELALRPHAAERFVQAVHTCGAGIVIDGYGRRSPSFDGFAALHPDWVKIDGALTRTLASDESCVARVQAIARLAESLGVGLIAECVESADVLLQLESLGVAHAQGYGVCRPQPIHELLARGQRAVA